MSDAEEETVAMQAENISHDQSDHVANDEASRGEDTGGVIDTAPEDGEAQDTNAMEEVEDDESIGEISSDSDDDGDDTAAAAASTKGKTIASDDESDNDKDQNSEITKEALQHKPKQMTSAVWDSDDEDDNTMSKPDGEFDPNPEEPVMVETKKINLPEYKTGSNPSLVKMPNFLDIDPKPFDHATYIDVHEQDDDSARDELGRKRIKLKVENSIRWRYSKDDDGEYTKKENGEFAKESNTNIVTWSDGSQSLVVGDQIINLVRQDIKAKHSGLFIIAPSEEQDTPCVQAISMFDERVALKPYSTKSRLHEQLTRSVAVTAGIRAKVKEILVDKNPETQVEENRKKALERARKEQMERNKLERAQQAAREQNMGMTSRFYEEDYRLGDSYPYDEGSSEGEEVEQEPQRKSPKRKKAKFEFESDDDADGVEDDSDSSEPSPPEKDKRKRKVVVEDDDSD